MRKILGLLVLIGLWTTACSPVPATKIKGQTYGNASPTDLSDPSTDYTPAAQTDSSSAPFAVTVRPPMLPVDPIGGTYAASSQGNWLTFTAADLGVSLDYPSDWFVTRQADGASFTSAQGARVDLQFLAGDDPKSSGQCVNLINSHGLSLDICEQVASNRYNASFNINLDGQMGQVNLSTSDSASLDVYRSMIDTLRLTH